MTALSFVPPNLHGPLRLAMAAAFVLVVISSILPWYELSGSTSASIGGYSQTSKAEPMSISMWSGQPFLALLLLVSSGATAFYSFKGASGGMAAKIAIASAGAVVLFAVLGAAIVPSEISGSTGNAFGSASSKVTFSLVWGGVFGLIFAFIGLILAVVSFAGVFVPPKTSA